MSPKTENGEDLFIENAGHVRHQWLISFLVNLPVLTYGIQAGWISPMAPVLRSSDSPLGVAISNDQLAWIASALFLGAAVSPPFYSYLADRFGRRISCIFVSIPQIITWLMTAFAPNVEVLVAARVISGMASGGAFCITPMFVKEISDDKLRGATGSLGMVIQSIGFLIIYAMGAFMDYHTVIYSVLMIPFLHIILSIFYIPETPSYLVKVENYQEAKKNIAWLRGLSLEHKQVENAFEKIKHEVESNKMIEKVSVKSIFTHKPWRKGLVISIILHGVRGMGGSLVILSYASVILDQSGVTVNKLAQTMTIPAIMIIGIGISLIIVDRIGRKPLLILGYSVMGVSLVAVGVVSQFSTENTSWSWVPITALMAATFGYGIGVLSVPYIILAEIFNVYVRATLLGYIAVYIWVIVFINVYTFEYIVDSCGIYTACYIYAGINFVGVIYSIIAVPETKGRSMDAIEKQLVK